MTTNIQQQAEAISDQIEATALTSNVSPGMQVGESLSSNGSEISGEVTDIRYKNLVSMWARETGIHSYALPYMVADLAKQRIKPIDGITGPLTGQSVFVFRYEDVPLSIRERPEGTKLPCYLNSNHPLAAKWHAMGFVACIKVNIPSQAALESHMAHSHKRAWATIQKDEEDRVRDEDREFSRANTLALQALVERLASGQQLTPAETVGSVGQEAIRQVVSDVPDEPIPTVPYVVTCETCELEVTGKSMAGALASLRAHEKREHPTTE